MRSTCIELGLSTSAVAAPLKGSAIKNFAIPNTISQAWYLGRAVHLARQEHANVTDAIVSLSSRCSVGADPLKFAIVPGKILFKGKIVDVTRDVSKGYTVGLCVIAPLTSDEVDQDAEVYSHHLRIPFQNEYLAASYANENGKQIGDYICTVPDLISILGEDGHGIGSQDLRFGLRVSVIAMPAHPLWTDNERALKVGGPDYFGLRTEWKSIGKYVPLKGVIEEYGKLKSSI